MYSRRTRAARVRPGAAVHEIRVTTGTYERASLAGHREAGAREKRGWCAETVRAIGVRPKLFLLRIGRRVFVHRLFEAANPGTETGEKLGDTLGSEKKNQHDHDQKKFRCSKSKHNDSIGAPRKVAAVYSVLSNTVSSSPGVILDSLFSPAPACAKFARLLSFRLESAPKSLFDYGPPAVSAPESFPP